MTEAVAAPRRGVFANITRIGIVRLILLAAILIAIDVGLQIAPGQLMPRPPPPAHVLGLINLGIGVVMAVVLALAYRVLIRLVERRKARELAFDGTLGFIVAGVLLGLALFCAVELGLVIRGYAHFNGVAGTEGLAAAAGLSLGSAVGEELVFRGVVFRVLEDSLGTTMAVILSAALFGLLHGMNPGATATSTAAIALEAGVLLAVAYAASRSLWLPIGIHFGWNFTEGGIFGAAVSGGKSKGLLDVSLSGPPLWTGGSFGPEASVLAVGVCLAAAAALIFWAVRAGRWKGLRLRLMLD